MAELKCPGCGGPTYLEGKHCIKCLEEAMDKMTSADWQREIGVIVRRITGEKEGQK